MDHLHEKAPVCLVNAMLRLPPLPEGVQLELDNAWWQGVENLIEQDLQADRDWWEEIEDAIREDEVIGIPAGKREPEACRSGDAKRFKKPG